jgi:hypothetical protein
VNLSLALSGSAEQGVAGVSALGGTALLTWETLINVRDSAGLPTVLKNLGTGQLSLKNPIHRTMHMLTTGMDTR